MTSLKWRKIVPEQVVRPHLLSGYAQTIVLIHAEYDKDYWKNDPYF